MHGLVVTTILNAKTGNKKKLFYMPHQNEHIYDAVKDKLHKEPEYVMTGANTTDLLSKRMKVPAAVSYTHLTLPTILLV